MARTSHIDIGREIVNSEWGREEKSAKEVIPKIGDDRLRLGLQAYTAYLLKDILQEMRLLTEPAKEKKRKEESERVEGRIARIARANAIHEQLRKKFKGDIGPMSARIIEEIKPLYFLYGSDKRWENGVRRADYFLKHPAEKWGDKELLQIRKVGKVMLRKFREEIKRDCTKPTQK